MTQQNNTVQEIDLAKLVKTIWNSRGMIIKWVVIGAIVGIIAAVSKPKEWETQMVIAPEDVKKGLSSSMGTFAGMMGVNTSGMSDDGVNNKIYPQIFKSRPFLLELSQMDVIYEDQPIPLYKYLLENQKEPWWAYIVGAPRSLINWIKSIGEKHVEDKPFDENLGKQAQFVVALSGSIKILSSEDNLTTISTTMQDPKIALQVIDSLYVNLQLYMTNYRTAKTRTSLKNNLKMMEDAKLEYYLRDSMYAAAKDRNQNLTAQTAKLKIERLENEKDLAFSVYQQLASQVETYKVKLLEETPIATVIEPAVEPIMPCAPNSKVIVILFTFFTGFGSVSWLVFKEIFKSNKPS